MSTMLKTINPEAAEAIANPLHRPDVGTRVVYVPRGGHQRNGRVEFPADVMAVDQATGAATLLVQMDANESIIEEHVHFQSHNQASHCWRYVRGSAEDIAQHLDALELAIFGEYEKPDLSLVECMADMEGRIKALGGPRKVTTAKRGKGVRKAK